MTDIEKCQLVWKGKSETKRKNKLNRNFHSLEVIESINTPKFTEVWKNRLILGDNKLVIASLLDELSGKIKVIYIDPPFASGTTFKTSIRTGRIHEETSTLASHYPSVWSLTDRARPTVCRHTRRKLSRCSPVPTV